MGYVSIDSHLKPLENSHSKTTNSLLDSSLGPLKILLTSSVSPIPLWNSSHYNICFETNFLPLLTMRVRACAFLLHILYFVRLSSSFVGETSRAARYVCLSLGRRGGEPLSLLPQHSCGVTDLQITNSTVHRPLNREDWAVQRLCARSYPVTSVCSGLHTAQPGSARRWTRFRSFDSL